MRRAFFAAATVCTIVAILASAHAAPPVNDDAANAVAFSTLPFARTADTAEATNGDDDPAGGCDGGATVWYRFTPKVDQSVIVSTAGSDYDAFVSVYAGSPKKLATIACAAYATTVIDARAGNTYFIVVSAPAGSSGGHLAFDARPSPFTIVIDPTGTFDAHTGTATVRATLTCAEPVAIHASTLTLKQAGRITLRGADARAAFVVCDPTSPYELETTISTGSGLYRGGRAQLSAAFTLALGGSLASIEASAAVTLHGR